MTEPRIHTREYPPVRTPTTPIWQTVLAGAAERGDHPAPVDGITGQTIGYAELAQMVERMAAGFAENGVRPGDVVALHSLVEFIETVPKSASGTILRRELRAR